MTLAACAKDIKFYRYPSLQLCAVYESQNNVSFKNISWCNDGEKLLVTKAKGYPVVLQRPKKLTDVPIEPIQEIERNGVIIGTFANTSTTIIALGCFNGNVSLYDISKKLTLLHYDELPASVNNLEFMNGDRCLAVGLVTGEIYLFNGNRNPSGSFMIPNSTSLSTMACHKQEHNLLAGGSKEGIVCAWDTETCDIKLIGKDHTNLVSDLTFSETTFTSVSIDGKIVFYDTRKNKYVESHNLKAPLSSLSHIPGTFELVVSTCEGQIRSYDLRYFTTPLHTVMYNSWIKQIRYPQMNTFDLSETNQSGSASTGGGVVGVGGVYDNFKVNLKKNPYSAMDDTSEKKVHLDKVTPMELNELSLMVDDKIRKAKTQFEEKLIQTFYALRIDASKQFIGLEEKIAQSWMHFIDYINSSTESNVYAKSVGKTSIKSVCITEVKSSKDS